VYWRLIRQCSFCLCLFVPDGRWVDIPCYWRTANLVSVFVLRFYFVLHRKRALYYRRMPFTAEGCPLLQKGALYCRRVPFITEGCTLLQKGDLYFRRMPFNTEWCPLPQKGALYCRRVPFTAEGCPLLQKGAAQIII